MSLKWKRESAKEAVTSGEAIWSLVDDAPGYYDDAIEGLQAKTEKLARIVAALVDTLPVDAQRKILEKVDNYEFKEVKP